MTATLLLDLTYWDLCTDAAGNIAVATAPYAIAQDVASACKLFLGDYWYDTTLGVPYFQNVLGQPVSIVFLKSQLAAAASTVPGCFNPIVFLSSVSGRKVTGQVQFTDAAGAVQVVGF